MTMSPNYTLSTRYGFVAYLTDKNGNHPSKVNVTGGTGKYDASLGRLTVTNVTGNLHIEAEGQRTGVTTQEEGTYHYYTSNGVLYVEDLTGQDVTIFNLLGNPVTRKEQQSGNCAFELAKGTYLLQIDRKCYKVLL